MVELNKIGVDKIFCEKESGKDFNRKQWRSLFRQLRKGDEIIILSIDRLGRNYDEILDNWKAITCKKKCDIQVLDMPLLNTKERINGLDGKFIANLVLEILSYVAQKERENNKIRQAQGIQIAKEKGVKFGRPKVDISNEQKDIIYKCLKGEYFTKEQAVIESNLARATFYRKLELARKGEL